MSPTSLVFFAFVAVALIVYYIVPKKAQWIVLLLASLFFMGYASKFAMLYMIATTAVVYGGALWIQKFNDEFKAKKKELSKDERKALKATIKEKQHTILTIMVIITIGVLAVLKYVNFFGEIVNSITGLIANRGLIPMVKLAVPLGISYYTLMSVSYIVDVYRGVIQAEKNPCRLLLFVCYFPHITEGPFDTYDKLAPQFKEYHKFDYDAFMNAGCLLLLGLVKKMVLADRLAYIANEVFDNYTDYSGIPILVGMLAYTIQIYFDFSGCIDIVRGISSMFGIDIAENFDRPFFSHSIQEFWRRWHITLGAWLKNYVFYPVSLSNFSKNITKSANKNIKNKNLTSTVVTISPLFCVWMTMGIWHGASWKYVVYGLYYFALILLGTLFEPLFVKFFEKTKIKRDGKAFGLFQIVRTDILVVIGLTMFRADTINGLINICNSTFKINSLNVIIEQFFGIYDKAGLFPLDYPLIIVGVIISFIISFKKPDLLSCITDSKRLRWLYITLMIIFIIAFGIYGTAYTEQPFVYAQF